MQAVRVELLVYIPQKLMEQMLLISNWEDEFTVKAFLKERREIMFSTFGAIIQ